MMGRFFKSRAFRKFRKSRMAMAASFIILGYLMVAIALFLGVLTIDDTMERIAPNHTPGFYGQPEPERRFLDAQVYIDPVERALKKKSPREALEEVRFGALQVADVPLEELQRVVDRAHELYAELDKADDLARQPEYRPHLEELDDVAQSLYAPLSGWDAFARKCKLFLGTDRQGRSIVVRAVYAIKIAIQIGTVVALFSVLFGSLLGAAAAYFGGWVDHVVIWLYSTLMAIPYLVLIAVLVYMFEGGILEKTLFPVYAAMGLTFWIGPCRVVRGEVLRIKELDYVQAALALGTGRFRILVKHILPNTAHLILVNFSLLFIGAIKSEVILTFLGLGVKEGSSWGIMISQSKQEVVNEFFWQIGAATVLMFGLVLAFNIFTDALQDAL